MDLTHLPNKTSLPSLPSTRRAGLALVPLSLALALLLWSALVRVGNFPDFFLPAPEAVWRRFLDVLADGRLLRHSAVTLSETLTGLAAGAISATVLGYFLAKSRSLERLLSPFIVASQSVPVVAVAPLLILWFGPGMVSKVLICALMVFFPVLVNTVVGLRSVPEELYELMRSFGATRAGMVRYLEIPAALPVFLGGLRIGATLAAIGAVVGEFVGSDRGLGFLINSARGQYDTALVFVAVFTLIGMAMSLYGVVVLLEARLLSWRQRPEGNGK